MLVLVLGANFPVMFVGWEGVGLCSYLLIGFWFTQEVGGRRRQEGVHRQPHRRLRLHARRCCCSSRPSARSTSSSSRSAASGRAIETTGWGVITIATLLLFLGATGKSAQIPLYVWLPDAMEGPTPVSALIHAATMVTAGVYMIGRNAVLFSHAPHTLAVVAGIGVATALMAGTIGLVQNDIKRVLAYSTVSQLGYMFLAMGVGAYAAGIFHLFTHAFFKALLFLGSGAVIHALAGEQDLRNMGGLKKYLPITYWTFLIGALAIAGVPLLSGFFSKDEILFRTFTQRPHAAAVGHRHRDVAADRDLHVPPGVPGVPRRAASRRAGRPRIRRKRSRPRTVTAMPRRAHGHGHGGTAHAPARCAAVDGDSADRARDRFGARRLRRRAARARRQQPHRVVPRAELRSERRRRRRGPPRPQVTPAIRPVAERRPSRVRANRARRRRARRRGTDRADADGGLERRRVRRHRHRVLLLAAQPQRRRRAGATQFGGVYRLLLNKYYVDELYDAAIVQPIKLLSTGVLWKGVDAG